MRTLVTGSSGFVARALLPVLLSRGHKPAAAQRCVQYGLHAKLKSFVVGNINAATIWSTALQDTDAVVHLAARAHVMHDSASDPLAEYRHVNTDGTLNLARQAVIAGVKRFVFISSIKVNGERTQLGCSYTANDVPAPRDAYGISKAEAEAGLRLLAEETGLEVVIIRPPLVYGPGVKANFRNLLQLADQGVPLPLSALDSNRRSFVGVFNLVDLTLLCLEHPAAANQTFHVSDDDDISTAELLRKMGKALGRPIHNFPIPQAVLKTGLRLAGKGEWVDKLCGDLRVDISETKRLLGWKPKVTMEEELERTARWWRTRKE